MDSPTVTLREIARDMNLPESTIRYYRDSFSQYIPTVGLGRRRRYPADALELFRIISQGYAQNWSREDIEARLAEIAPANAGSPPAAPSTSLRLHRQTPAASQPTEELMATMMDGERERRDVMWQLAREIVRMGEVLERQQMALMQITQHLDWGSRAIAPIPGLPMPYLGPQGQAPGVPDETALAKELHGLREELQKERELVERLRRSKLEIERRATAAETELQHRAESPDMGALRRFLGKEQG